MLIYSLNFHEEKAEGSFLFLTRIIFQNGPLRLKTLTCFTKVNLDKLRYSGLFYEKLMRNPEIYLNLALEPECK